MPPKDSYDLQDFDFNDLKNITVAYEWTEEELLARTDEQADLISAEGTTRFQWHHENPAVTVLFFDSNGYRENLRYVPMDHARALWSKLIASGWLRKV